MSANSSEIGLRFAARGRGPVVRRPSPGDRADLETVHRSRKESRRRLRPRPASLASRKRDLPTNPAGGRRVLRVRRRGERRPGRRPDAATGPSAEAIPSGGSGVGAAFPSSGPRRASSTSCDVVRRPASRAVCSPGSTTSANSSNGSTTCYRTRAPACGRLSYPLSRVSAPNPFGPGEISEVRVIGSSREPRLPGNTTQLPATICPSGASSILWTCPDYTRARPGNMTEGGAMPTFHRLNAEEIAALRPRRTGYRLT